MVREKRYNNSNYYGGNYNFSSWSAGEGSGGGGGGVGIMKEEEEEEKPAWLEGLIGETFFGSCVVHEERRKKEKNVYCLNCCLSICPHCIPSHPSHPLLQVRRYVYHDVVRLGDLDKLIDCSYIQPYTINSAKVIFLNERAQSRSGGGGGGGGGGKAASSSNICFTCDRILQHPFHFCSLSCKVEHMVEEGQELRSILVAKGGSIMDDDEDEVEEEEEEEEESEENEMALSQFEGLRMMDCDDEDEHQLMITSSSMDHSYAANHHYYGSHPSEPQMKMTRNNNKKNSKQPSGFIRAGIKALSLSSRRKGAPQRSPLS